MKIIYFQNYSCCGYFKSRYVATKTSSTEYLYPKFCNSVTNTLYNEWIYLSHNNEKTSGYESCNVHDSNFSWILHPLSKLEACLIACLELSLDSLRVLTCSRGMSSSLRHHQPLRHSRTMKLTQRHYKHQYLKTRTVLSTPIMPQQRATNSSYKFGSKKSPKAGRDVTA